MGPVVQRTTRPTSEAGFLCIAHSFYGKAVGLSLALVEASQLKAFVQVVDSVQDRVKTLVYIGKGDEALLQKARGAGLKVGANVAAECGQGQTEPCGYLFTLLPPRAGPGVPSVLVATQVLAHVPPTTLAQSVYDTIAACLAVSNDVLLAAGHRLLHRCAMHLVLLRNESQEKHPGLPLVV